MGALSGYRIIELAGIGPGPMCAMLLSDMGADVLRIDRTADAALGIAMETKYSLLNRGRRSVALDLKKPEAIEAVLRLVDKADALIEGFRPGVTERLGLARHLHRAQSAAGLWAHDGMGSGRSDGARRGPRY